MDLRRLEHKLKERLQFDYQWKRVQNNQLDRLTSEIYHLYGVKSVLNAFSGYSKEVINYALNRWYNFFSAKGVEYIFTSHENVHEHPNRYHKKIDFFIDDIPFDHKTTVLPKSLDNNIEYALENKEKLIQWLYENQSKQGRYHLGNRLFVLVFDSKELQHWKVKAEIALIKERIEQYLRNFNANNLVRLNLNGREIKSDIIFVIN